MPVMSGKKRIPPKDADAKSEGKAEPGDSAAEDAAETRAVLNGKRKVKRK